MIFRKYLIHFYLFSFAFTVQGQVIFEDVTAEIPEANNAWGVLLADYDNDGDDDIFVASEPVRLIRNDGQWQFTDVTQEAGLASLNSHTALWADLNNDGWLDLISSTRNQTIAYFNDGNGRFADSYELNNGRSQSLLAGDINGDGWPDLFSSNLNERHQLLLNAGNGILIDEAESRNVASRRIGMGGLLLDFDDDNDLDIFLVYDGYQPYELFINDGSGFFSEEAATYGLDRESQAMGVDEEDLNNDGMPDFYVTNLFENYLLMSGPDGYREIGGESGTDDYGMGWGTRIFDADNDGNADIYVNNEYDFSPYPNLLYINRGDNTFFNVATDSVLGNYLSGYAVATSDMDNDGLQDIVLVNKEQEASIRILRNISGATGNWIQFDLIGQQANSHALGAVLTVFAGGKKWKKTVRAGAGWISQNGHRLYFGLDAAGMVDSVEIRWPDGTRDIHDSFDVNARYLVVQGEMPALYDPGLMRSAISRASIPNLPAVSLPDLPDEDIHVARQWNEALLLAIRNDFARPTVHARNLYHLSLAMYEAWAVLRGNTILLGKDLHGFESPFSGYVAVGNEDEAIQIAISYAAYRLLEYRFSQSPGRGISLPYFRALMDRLGYDRQFEGTNYRSNDPRALGNHIAAEIIRYGLQDGSNERDNYSNLYYQPFNGPLFPFEPGNPSITDPNRWQPLELVNFIDQSGNADGTTPPFLSPEWGNVIPFALAPEDAIVYERDGATYRVYHDPGPPPYISNQTGLEDAYKWHHTMVSVWSAHLDPADGVMMDISPAAIGNNDIYPDNQEGYEAFYDFLEGGDSSQGYPENPATENPYAPNVVPRGDFARVLAEFWADGPDSETPPGHWFTILNTVMDDKDFIFHWMGDEPMDSLEWTLKAYLTLGGAMHDAAISAWSVKGYYDYIRPISAIRYMAERGQSTDPEQPSYDPHGLPLIPGYVEIIGEDEPLAGSNNEHTGKIKVYAWRGHAFISDPETETAGVGWIRAEDWFSYQRPTFVTPPFAGYVSGHSTFSNAAAEVLSQITGSEYFPGGLGEFLAPRNEFLVFEEGPSMDIVLQWARYRDAADQSSLSRIWGGIHPPADDIPGRKIGIVVGDDAVKRANELFSPAVVTSVQELMPDIFRIYPKSRTSCRC